MLATAEKDYLASARYVDSAHPAVMAFARHATRGANSERDKALALYGAVRDEIRYDPYIDFNNAENFRASGVLAARRGFCVGKAALLAACARAVGISARVGYADVRNHMTSKRMHDLMQTDTFCWHSYTDLKIDGRWVKSTPAFDAALCRKIGLPPLDFDGVTDSLFQAFDPQGQRHMEYLRYRGDFADVPYDTIIADFHKLYPRLFTAKIDGDFAAEAQL
ncbi:MAG TPA: transglutaminase family protein [Pseudolabrys sp.]|nr:transglutaminase family protein [Pseudolabrys sp.]